MKTLGYAAALAAVTAAFALAAAAVPLSGCAKGIALKITNVYENGDTQFHYDYCENLKDGRGYTAGIAGFCTGTGDAWQVVQRYHKMTGGNDAFSPMDKVLAQYAESGSDSTAGLSDYCPVWGQLGKNDAQFRKAQDGLRDDTYFNPSQVYADRLGLKFDVSRAQLYDAAIQHGTGNDGDSLGALIKYTNQRLPTGAPQTSGSTLTINGQKVDEIAWLKQFLQIREADLKNPREPDNRGGNYWAQTTYRTKSYAYIISQGEFRFAGSVKILDNDGKPMVVSC
ncbi:hypothetical protein H4R19_002423 [Coemansia spiralis]|nr:hypothetical protein H4R19_002423 [Coemansia spiralis]